jgi:hypothetical protein
MDRKELREFIDDFFLAWKNWDEEKVPTFYDKNVQAYSDFKPVALNDILERFQFSRRKFLALDHGIQDLFIDETQGKVAIRMKQNHILRDNPLERVSCEVISLYKIVDYKITEIWMSFYPNVDYLNNN